MKGISHLFIGLLVLNLAVVFGNTQREILASDGMRLDRFGQALAVDRNRVLVGSTGDDDFGSQSGSAYLIDLLSGEEIAKLNAPDGVARDAFGSSVALKGNLAIVGVPDDDDHGDGSGAAWVFDLNRLNDADYEPVKLAASDAAAGDNFGNAVAIDGEHIVVAAWKDGDEGDDYGAVYVFDAVSNQERHKLVATDRSLFDQFGGSVAIGNGLIIVGAAFANAPELDSGAAYLFDANSGNLIDKLVAPDGSAGDTFGESVAIADGLIVVGASNFEEDDGDSLAGTGRAYLFEATTGNFVDSLSPPNEELGARFGVSVSIGSQIAVGAYFASKEDVGSAGAVYVFQRDGEFQTKLQRANAGASDFLGQAVEVAGRRVVAGIPQADTNGSQSGSAIVFDLAPIVVPILQISVLGHDVHLSWGSEGEQTYRLYSSLDLKSWDPLGGQLSTGSYIDRDATGGFSKFYQLQPIP